MASFKRFVTTLVVAVSILSSYLTMTTEATPTYHYHFCSNTTTFNLNSPYKSNLDIVLSNLSSNAAQESDFIFFRADAGDNGTSNYVYGIYLCRGDVNSAICHDCVLTSIEYARQKCSVEKEVIIWYDECMLRYSNQSFQSTMSASPSFCMWNTQNATESDKFKQEVEKTMNECGSKAAKSAKKFMVQEADISGFDTIYSLVQCTQDLSIHDCTKCLQYATSSFPPLLDGKEGARVFLPSCIIRYELYPFYEAAESPKVHPLITRNQQMK
ncbi:cysteine-rich receptor-like protein kinase 25 [Ziziphus jujuba]|uniref:Cysteine-rich receptor-like protein kinase 25 n=1 Tax=Ziziphus jujuba TaxID=326968 RepID=A0ABM4AFM2_ZIZJJ|nr:cysteine-rich receptor-like protein kinase 25 [Ziziphus jujuba]